MVHKHRNVASAGTYWTLTRYTSDMAVSTIFGRILAGEISCNKVFEDDVCLAFRDIAPIAPVHILVIPKRQIASLAHVEQTDAETLGHLLHRAAEIGKEQARGGFRIVINSGSDGGQTVDHLHLHVLGGRRMGWPPG